MVCGDSDGGDGVTLGDAVSTKSPMKMLYRKLPKTASLPVTRHAFVLTGFLCLNERVRTPNVEKRRLNYAVRFPLITGLVGIAT
jgi:hypothetical protein